MVNVSSNNSSINISNSSTSSVQASEQGNSQRAKNWAVGVGLIDGEDYSSKYYAQQSKGYKDSVENYIDGFDETVETATNGAVSTIATTLENSVDTLSDTKDNILSDLNSTAESLNDSLTATGTIQNTRLVNTGDYYTSEMETLLEGAQDAEKNAKASEEKAKEYADQASKGQIQADYAETDTTEKSYIKNKPDLSVYATNTALSTGLAGKQDTISDLETIRSGASAGATAVQPATLSAHTSDTSNPHEVTKAQVGLGNADNTSDLDKPISTATQAALDTKVNTSDIWYDGGTSTLYIGVGQ